MASVALRRLLHAAISLVGISFVVFVLVHSAPGDPVERRLGGIGSRHASPEVVAAIRAEMRLDEPLIVRYGAWLAAAVRLDFGDSFVERSPVARVVAERLPVTLLLAFTALAVSVLLAVPLGMAGAHRAGSAGDVAGGLAATAAFSIPGFWLSLILLQIFAVRLDWFPLFGMPSADSSGLAWMLDLARHMALPVAALSLGPVAYLSRFVRAATLDSRGRDYMRTARAKGLSEFGALLRHGLKNAVPPLVSLLSVLIPGFLSACVVVERIFRWHGIGDLFVDSVVSRDYPVVMALTLVTAVLSLAAGAAADLMHLWIDPRVAARERA